MIKKTSSDVFQESEGNRLLEQELEKNQRIKTYFSENDRTPNTDGYFEILKNNGIPLKRFVVQIKSTKEKHKISILSTGEYSYSTDSAFFQYIQDNIDSNPAMFFVIDIENTRVFFKYLSSLYLSGLWLSSQKKHNSDLHRKDQKTVTIRFSDNDILNEEGFYKLCEDICNGMIPVHRPMVRNKPGSMNAMSKEKPLKGTELQLFPNKSHNHNLKVFISYSWASDAYQARVIELATKLVDFGLDIIIDQWDLKYGQDYHVFMEESICSAEKVLILCESTYKLKADKRTGGVGTETAIITKEIFCEHYHEKFIPVIMEDGEISEVLPIYLKTIKAVLFTTGTQREYKELLCAIYGTNKKNKAPQISKVQVLSTQEKDTGSCSKRASHVFQTDNKEKIIVLGHYPQGENAEVEPLQWRVLSVDEIRKRMLLITEKIVDCHCYHDVWEDITWKECALREWLNSDFLQEAFTLEEQQNIISVTNQNTDNMDWSTKGGEDSPDKIFLLSIDEVEKYMDDHNRIAVATPYSMKRGSCVVGEDRLYNGGYWWWLRSPGNDNTSASCVAQYGRVLNSGLSIRSQGISVRPALWIKL